MSFLPGGHDILGDVTETDRAAQPIQPAQPVLYTGIVLYSSQDPEASAMLVSGGLIAWTGPEDTARVIHDGAQIVDATGCLITPGFVDAAATADGSAPDPGTEASRRRPGDRAAPARSDGGAGGRAGHRPGHRGRRLSRPGLCRGPGRVRLRR